MKDNFLLAKKETIQSFGNDNVYIEKFIENPRHIEVQIIGDHNGNLIHVEKESVPFKGEIKKLLRNVLALQLVKMKDKKFVILP